LKTKLQKFDTHKTCTE